MTKRDGDFLALSFMEIEAEFEALAGGRVVDGALDASGLRHGLLHDHPVGSSWVSARISGLPPSNATNGRQL
jgi:hypothetical protein